MTMGEPLLVAGADTSRRTKLPETGPVPDDLYCAGLGEWPSITTNM